MLSYLKMVFLVIGVHFAYLFLLIFVDDVFPDRATNLILGAWNLSSIYLIFRLHKSAGIREEKGRGLALFVAYILAISLIAVLCYLLLLMHAYSQITDWR